MVRSYSRHGESACLGLVASPVGSAIFDGTHAIVPALEDVLVWDTKRGESSSSFHATGVRSSVTCLAQSPASPGVFAVGHADGSIRIWDRPSATITVTLDGHRKAITALAFDATGTRLASGSQDTDIVLWDVVAETGLFRLRGHRDQVTSLVYASADHLLSGSKDTMLKLWHLPTQHCVETTIAHRAGGCWTLATLPLGEPAQEGTMVVLSGGGEGELKLWRIRLLADVAATTSTAARPIELLASVALSSASHAHRISQVVVDVERAIVAVQTTDRHVELCRVRTADELAKKLARRKKRERERAAAKGVADGTTAPAADEATMAPGEMWADRVTSWKVLQPGGKVRALAFAPHVRVKPHRKPRRAAESEPTRLMVVLSNNSIETFDVPARSSSAGEPTRVNSVGVAGHRADVRALAVSSDDTLIASASNGELKVWNRRTGKVVRTMSTGSYALCCAWLPGDKHIIIGTRTGALELYDVAASSAVTAVADAHIGAVWALQVRPDGRGLVTGSADQSVKFFDFEVRQQPSETSEAPTKTLALVHTRTLKMTDDVLSVRISPDGRLLAVALLDSTVKVFFADSLKFFLSLYGHKLPVLSMDIAHDSKLIATCSADKNVKLWGLDHGDCHRSIFAHEDSVMGVAFEAETHNLFSVGKDRMLKYWDGDRLIQKLEGHHAEVWTLAASRRGNFVVTAGADMSIRVWIKTDEPLFLEEERERELEKLYDAAPVSDQADKLVPGRAPGDRDEDGDEVAAVSKTTNETLSAGERLVEAIERADADAVLTEGQPRDPVLAQTGEDGPRHVLRVVASIPAPQLNDALLVLPFGHSLSLLRYADAWLAERWRVMLATRIALQLLRTHFAQLVATQSARDVLASLRSHMSAALESQKRVTGYNLGALEIVRRQLAARRSAVMFENDLREGVVTADDAAPSGVKRKRAVR